MPDQPCSTDSFQAFGDLLKFLRRPERLTRLELSIAVGYSKAQIGRLEKKQPRPDLTAVKALFRPALHLEHEPEMSARLMELALHCAITDGCMGIAPFGPARSSGSGQRNTGRH